MKNYDEYSLARLLLNHPQSFNIPFDSMKNRFQSMEYLFIICLPNKYFWWFPSKWWRNMNWTGQAFQQMTKQFFHWSTKCSREKNRIQIFFIFYLFFAHSRNLHRKFTRFRSLCPKIVRSLYQKCGGTKSACYAGHSIYVLGNIVWWIREWALIAFLCRYPRKAVGFLCNP